MKKSFAIYFSIITTLSVATAGAMYAVYGFLPHQDYIPAGLAVTAAAGIFVYIVLSRIVEI
jgi:hypothetical protein